MPAGVVPALKQFTKSVLLPPSGPRPLRAGVARGIVMEMDFRRNTRLYLGMYEIELTRYLRRLLTAGSQMFDVGAQIGYHSLLFARLGGGRVAAFECDPESVAVLEHNLTLNPELAERIEVVRGVVGVGPGEVGLDEFAYSRAGFVPDFIKVDVDGGELQVLLSANRLLGEHHPALIVETHSPALEADCGAMLVDVGYRPVIVNQRRWFADQRCADMNRWLVCEPPIR